MTENSALYTCPTCGLEVVGRVSPDYPYLCTGAPGHGHEATEVVPAKELVQDHAPEPLADVELG